jgi:hypothetical protein
MSNADWHDAQNAGAKDEAAWAKARTLTVRADCARCNGRGWRPVRVLTETGGIAPMPETIRALCECVRAE